MEFDFRVEIRYSTKGGTRWKAIKQGAGRYILVKSVLRLVWPGSRTFFSLVTDSMNMVGNPLRVYPMSAQHQRYDLNGSFSLIHSLSAGYPSGKLRAII
ncbi:MAG: hypothetical protein KAT85_04550 [candidate division Zixibacteria bacterium]|nr:hypothetical protein [candidate division Zixibacteria bacterium]